MSAIQNAKYGSRTHGAHVAAAKWTPTKYETARSVYGWRVTVMHWLGKVLRVHFHVLGEPFGKTPTRWVWLRASYTGGIIHGSPVPGTSAAVGRNKMSATEERFTKEVRRAAEIVDDVFVAQGWTWSVRGRDRKPMFADICETISSLVGNCQGPEGVRSSATGRIVVARGLGGLDICLEVGHVPYTKEESEAEWAREKADEYEERFAEELLQAAKDALAWITANAPDATDLTERLTHAISVAPASGVTHT